MTTSRAERIRPQGVEALEPWSLDVGGIPLWLLVGSDRVRTLGALGLRPRAVGELLAEPLARAVELLPPADTIHACGGLSAWPGLAAALARRLGRAVAVSPDPVFGACRAGAVLAGARCLSVDLGQTAAKAADGAGGVARVPRGEQGPADLLAAALLELAPRGVVDRPLVLALPCELGDDLAAGACTYPELRGPSAVGRLLDAAGRSLEAAGAPFRPSAVLVLNDAELAAVAAAAERTVLGRTLVLTLGHGPGASLLVGS